MREKITEGKNTKAQAEILMTTEQVAAMLQVKRSTLEQWRWRGQGPDFIKLNRTVRYQRSSVEAFTNAREFSSTTAARHSSAD